MRPMGVVEVSPRDGLQNDPGNLSAEGKVDLITRCAAAGIRRVEAASFVSPRAVPKMADAEAVIDGARQRRVPASLIGLVVNERGVARAVAAGIDEINVVVVATDTFSRRNQGSTTAESIAGLADMIDAAHQAGKAASVTVGAAFGCPFEGEVSLGRLVDVAGAAAAAGPDEIALADTIGVAVPTDVTERVAAVREAVGPDVTLRAHFHNTRNTGIANAVAAVTAGVTTLDASVGGIGGCPFAPAATGNIATEDLTYLLERMGLGTGLALDQLIDAARWLAGAIGHPLPGMLSKAGPFPSSGSGPAGSARRLDVEERPEVGTP